MVLLVPVTIPSTYSYIRGTVNEVNTVFVADVLVNDLCLCYVTPASSYAVVINFYDENNVVISTYEDTIIQDENSFIFDRTQADIDYIKNLSATQRASITSDLKGALNISDYQRLAVNCETVAYLDDVTLPEEPVLSDVPDYQYFTDIYSNMTIIVRQTFHVDDTPNLPLPVWNTFQAWNAVEKILYDNFDIRTTRFKYFGGTQELPMKTADTLKNVVIESAGKVYKTDASNIKDIADSTWNIFLSQYNFTEVT